MDDGLVAVELPPPPPKEEQELGPMREAADSAHSFWPETTQDTPKADLSLNKMISVQQPPLVVGNRVVPPSPNLGVSHWGLVIVVEMMVGLLEEVGLPV